MVKKKECYTKKTKTGKNYTTCVEGQKKPKRKRRTKAQMAEARAMAAQDKPAPKAKAKAKPEPKAPKKLSAGKAVLLTQRGFMAKVGAYAIPKKMREKRFWKWMKVSGNTIDKIRSEHPLGNMATMRRRMKKLKEIISESAVIDKGVSDEYALDYKRNGNPRYADRVRLRAEKMLKSVKQTKKRMEAKAKAKPKKKT